MFPYFHYFTSPFSFHKCPIVSQLPFFNICTLYTPIYTEHSPCTSKLHIPRVSILPNSIPRVSILPNSIPRVSMLPNSIYPVFPYPTFSYCETSLSVSRTGLLYSWERPWAWTGSSCSSTDTPTTTRSPGHSDSSSSSSPSRDSSRDSTMGKSLVPGYEDSRPYPPR